MASKASISKKLSSTGNSSSFKNAAGGLTTRERNRKLLADMEQKLLGKHTVFDNGQDEDDSF